MALATLTNVRGLALTLPLIVAAAHSVLVVIYHVLRDQRPYTDLGEDYFDRLETERLQRDHVRRLEPLGFQVSLAPALAASALSPLDSGGFS